MTLNKDLLNEIISSIYNINKLKVIKQILIGKNDLENELILFVKPEMMMVRSENNIKASLELIFEKLQEYKVDVDGIMALDGNLLDEKKIMDHHYGFINRLSRTASKMMSSEDLEIIAKQLNLSSLSGFDILGGHEYLTKYPSETAADLDQLWFTKKSIKIRSGFYVQSYKKENSDILLVNGFHPAQLAHFTNPAHKILLFLIHTNTNWKTLKNEMVGATFPEKALPSSIRGSFYSDPQKYGLETVSIANNGVHLSAGPFEAAFELRNFFGETLNIDWNTTNPLLISKILSKGINLKAAYTTLDNPQVLLEGRDVDLFTATEDQNTEDAINIWTSGRKQV